MGFTAADGSDKEIQYCTVQMHMYESKCELMCLMCSYECLQAGKAQHVLCLSCKICVSVSMQFIFIFKCISEYYVSVGSIISHQAKIYHFGTGWGEVKTSVIH